jgi:hypothetical protein
MLGIGVTNSEAIASMTQQEIGGTNLEENVFTILQETGWVRSIETPAANERFGAMAAVSPLKRSEKLVSRCSTDSSVNAATAPSRVGVTCNGGSRSTFIRRNKVETFPIQKNTTYKKKFLKSQ